MRLGLPRDLYEGIVESDDTWVKRLTQLAVEQGWDPQDVLANVFGPAMDQVGKRFEEGDFSFPRCC